VNHPAVTRYIPVEPQTLESERAFIADVLAHAPLRPNHHFAVVDAATAEVIGHARFGVAEGIGPDLSYMLRKDRWGRGFGTEVARCLVDFGFNVLGHDEIFVTCAPDNVASLHVIEKVGFSFVERRQRHMMVHGEPRDSLVFHQSRQTGSD
jgi:[ribosomal protein S5]-alanine N-acetyltransferase